MSSHASTRRRLLVALGSGIAVGAAGCSEAEELLDDAPNDEPDPENGDTPTDVDGEDTPDPDPENGDTPDDTEDPETPEEPDLQTREEELPELIRETIQSSRGYTQEAISVYAAGGEFDGTEPPLLSVPLVDPVDRIDVQRELDDAESRLESAVSRADRQNVDDEPFQRLVELLDAEIRFLSIAAETHAALADGFELVEETVDLADQNAYGLAADRHDELGELLAATTADAEMAAARVDPIVAATDEEREALESPHHPELASRLEAGAEALSEYHDTFERFAETLSTLDDAATASDDDEALALSQIAIDDLETVESELEAVDIPAGVEPLHTDLEGYINERLEEAREIRDEAAAALD